MATTSNYSWTTPDDTDLVKDGAAAIRTLGSSADTTVKDLNPGTTAGDIDYYTSSTAKARVAIGTAGQVLIVNAGGTAPEWGTTADQTPLTTKGDLFTFDTADARLGVGADGTVLTAASGEATGLEWAAPAAPSLVGVQLNTSAGFSISNNTFTLVDWDTEVFDTDGFHSTVSNTSRVTIPSGKSGKYQVTVRIPWGYNNAGYRRVVIKRGGSTNDRFEVQAAPQVNTTSAATVTMSSVMDVTAGDYYEIELYQNTGGTLTTFGGIAWGEWTWIYLGA